ncbi:MAG: POTRA domain-containing protein, partial [Myxococcota bacterium]
MAARRVRSAGGAARVLRPFCGLALVALLAGLVAGGARGEPIAPLAIAPAAFDIFGCTAFDHAALSEIVAPYAGRPLESADLLALVDAIRERYALAGYGTTEVFLPDQDLEDGRIEIRIEEGRLEAIEIEGTLAYQPLFFRSRIARAAAVPLDVPKLYRTLERLQAEPGVERIAAVLERIGPGRHRLRVAVQERSPWSLQARYSNDRAPSVG